MAGNIGVLALQGDFEAHRKALRKAGAHPVEVRTAADLQRVDGLIIPGGESTTMLKLLRVENLFEPLCEFGQTKPIFGTCAGAILLASEVTHPRQESLNLMDLTVERNGYGRQIDSRVAEIDVEGSKTEAVFIRAPIIRRVGPGAHVLATYLDSPVLVEQGRHMVATFHPELTADSSIHKRFVEKVEAQARQAQGVAGAEETSLGLR
ncbi:MAG TPA: pyridoxal 5'-phosphate synthase glutaminase subunit PdxT [Bryobacteraceae bacterium]|jgi:5'-phosphate synthase pdxT subunit|nr:pyridoxal 5'-phosphate synthase glutaminase subunit PdxT [Bryobacteraceae bacterium]